MNAEKEKALHLSKAFEEQDNIDQGESEDESTAQPKHQDLAGVKVLHGLDKVMEGGAVVLTLKDQSILSDGVINQDVDMLENVEIGELEEIQSPRNIAAKIPVSNRSRQATDEHVIAGSEVVGVELRGLRGAHFPGDDEGCDPAGNRVTMDAVPEAIGGGRIPGAEKVRRIERDGGLEGEE
ncbi:hypothetical protein RJ640_021516 [Escallonia rubra]|uniref:Uncharacterized protein n=1 Tax=Escallonia rubra TaxID=112253 RepID=A0AA88QE05_9ASTE|nr:hypothetical protein RJ640_021516 [Escallonia rubra]